jgi:hypothetical protein
MLLHSGLSSSTAYGLMVDLAAITNECLLSKNERPQLIHASIN